MPKPTVIRRGLSVMAWLAESNPVSLVKKYSNVAFMRHSMIDNSSASGALSTARVPSQESKAQSLPLLCIVEMLIDIYARSFSRLMLLTPCGC